MYRLFLAVAVAVAMTAGAATTQANAKPSPSSYQGVMSLTLGSGNAPGMPVGVLQARHRQLSTAAKSCSPKHAWARWTYKNLVGVVLWKYTEQVDYCFTGSAVTYFYRNRWADLPSILPVIGFNPWKFDGNISDSCTNEHCFIRGYRAASRTATTQGQFEVCGLKFIGVCNNQTPRLSITVFGDGSRSIAERGD